MLPDFPDIKRKIVEKISVRINRIIDIDPLETSKHAIFEGNRFRIIRYDGSIDDTELNKLSGNITINLNDFEQTTMQGILEKVDECAKEMAEQKTHDFLSTIDKAIESVGSTIHADGKLTPEHYFHALEMLQMSFKADKSPNLPTLFASSEMIQKFEEMMKTIESTPELKMKLNSIIQKKRSEWLDRESSRKLVG